MFNRSRRNLAHWFTLSMGSILILFAAVMYYQRVVDRLEESDRLLYRKARIMAANIDYEIQDGIVVIDMRDVPILGTHSPPLDISLVHARWYTADGRLRQFYGAHPPINLQSTAAFETIRTQPEWLRQLTLPVEYNHRTIGYLQVAIPLTETQAALRGSLVVLTLAVPLTLGAIAITGWFLGGLAMRPIQESFNQLQRFTSDASHELRAPLAAIMSNAQVGLLNPIEEGHPKHIRLEKIAEAAKSMNTLVGQLLFLARQPGRLAPNATQSTDLNQLLQKTIALSSIQSASQHIMLHLDVPEERVLIQSNPELLQQAVINLVTNACKYTPSEGQVWVRLVSQYHRILIQVEDTGVGIPAIDLPHIFERFYRVSPERTREAGGTGLGLAIAKQIVTAHGGYLTVSSQLGRGSLFQIEFPPI